MDLTVKDLLQIVEKAINLLVNNIKTVSDAENLGQIEDLLVEYQEQFPDSPQDAFAVLKEFDLIFDTLSNKISRKSDVIEIDYQLKSDLTYTQLGKIKLNPNLLSSNELETLENRRIYLYKEAVSKFLTSRFNPKTKRWKTKSGKTPNLNELIRNNISYVKDFLKTIKNQGFENVILPFLSSYVDKNEYYYSHDKLGEKIDDLVNNYKKFTKNVNKNSNKYSNTSELEVTRGNEKILLEDNSILELPIYTVYEKSNNNPVIKEYDPELLINKIENVIRQQHTCRIIKNRLENLVTRNLRGVEFSKVYLNNITPDDKETISECEFLVNELTLIAEKLQELGSILYILYYRLYSNIESINNNCKTDLDIPYSRVRKYVRIDEELSKIIRSKVELTFKTDCENWSNRNPWIHDPVNYRLTEPNSEMLDRVYEHCKNIPGFEVTYLRKTHLTYFSDGRFSITPDAINDEKTKKIYFNKSLCRYLFTERQEEREILNSLDSNGNNSEWINRPCIYHGEAWIIKFLAFGKDLLQSCRVYFATPEQYYAAYADCRPDLLEGFVPFSDLMVITSDWCSRNNPRLTYATGIDLYTPWGQRQSLEVWILGPCLTKFRQSNPISKLNSKVGLLNGYSNRQALREWQIKQDQLIKV